MRWNNTHQPANPTGVILIYAWNEIDEGGWLVPTQSEGDARLKAIAAVLSKAFSIAIDSQSYLAG